MSLTPSQDGIIEGEITVPANTIPAGAKLIEFTGSAIDEPNRASAQFVAKGSINITEIQETRRRVIQETRYWCSLQDPLAQSFAVVDDCQISYVDCWMDVEAGLSAAVLQTRTDVVLQIREMINGFPGPKVLAESIRSPEQLQLWRNGSTPASGVTHARITQSGLVNTGDAGLNNVAFLASSMIEGKRYTIKSLGNTNFTLYGASSNTVGVSFIRNQVELLSAAGQGTVTSDGVHALTIGGPGVDAAGTFTVTDGRVTNITITRPGTGYTTAPELDFSACHGLSGAAGAASVGDYNRFEFPPTLLWRDQQYAIVLLCNDAIWRVRVGVMGGTDAVTRRRITLQPYTVGVLFSSSNNVSWTIHQDRDMTFRVGGPTYTSSTRTINFPRLTLTEAADYLALMCAYELPTADCSVKFAATVGSTTIDILPNTFNLLNPPAAIGTQIDITATLTGTELLTPVIEPDYQIFTGLTTSPSIYETRDIQIQARPDNSTTGATRISILYEYRSRGAATITCEVYDPNADPEDAWIEVMPDESAWLLPMADDWREQQLVLQDFDPTATSTRLRITLTGTALARPELRKLRVVIADNPDYTP